MAFLITMIPQVACEKEEEEGRREEEGRKERGKGVRDGRREGEREDTG